MRDYREANKADKHKGKDTSYVAVEFGLTHCNGENRVIMEMTFWMSTERSYPPQVFASKIEELENE